MDYRQCKTYDYWHDLRTDLRWPDSWLDFVNMLLRRIRLILVKEVNERTGKALWWKIGRWETFLDEVHEQGRCEVCQR